MANLLTIPVLARWTQSDEGDVAGDPFAVDLIEKISDMICFVGGHPDWHVDPDGDEEDKAPVDVQMIALQVCKRSYENPGQVLQEGNVGPLGGDRVADVQALFADLTERERATIAKYNPDGDPTPPEGAGEVFVLPTTRGDETTLPQTSPLYMGDNLQINLESSDDPREWMIPMFNPGDPGDDSLYPDED